MFKCERCGCEDYSIYRANGTQHYLCDDCADDVAKWEPALFIKKYQDDKCKVEINNFAVVFLGESKINELICDYIAENYCAYEVKDVFKNDPCQRDIAVEIGLENE